MDVSQQILRSPEKAPKRQMSWKPVGTKPQKTGTTREISSRDIGLAQKYGHSIRTNRSFQTVRPVGPFRTRNTAEFFLSFLVVKTVPFYERLNQLLGNYFLTKVQSDVKGL